MPQPLARPSAPRNLLDRLSRWVGSDDAPPAANDGTGLRFDAGETLQDKRRQALFADIGEFLFANGLEITPQTFNCAYDYLCGNDRALEQAIRAELHANGAISNQWVEGYFADRPRDGLDPAALSATAEKLEGELAKCIGLVDRSRGSADAYGDALAAQSNGMPGQGDALPIIERLVGLTREMLDQTRQIQLELRDSAKDARALRATLRRARQDAMIDHLTGLGNRRACEQRLKEAHAAARISGADLTIAMCDVDRFKTINDDHGHDTGDRVLRFIANLLRGASSRGYHPMRYGGEEFLLIFEGRSIDEVAPIVEDIRAEIADKSLVNQETGRPIGQVTMSFGVAAIDRDTGIGHGTRLADTALYQAKQTGRNRACFADHDGQVSPAPAG